MCGRIIQAPAPVRLAIVGGLDAVEQRCGNVRPRHDGAAPVVGQRPVVERISEILWNLVER